MLVVYLILGIVTFIVVVMGLRWFLMQPVKYKINDLNELQKFISDLYKYFQNGSVLVATNKKTGYFIQFAKYKHKDKVNLTFGYPDARWSKKILKK